MSEKFKNFQGELSELQGARSEKIEIEVEGQKFHFFEIQSDAPSKVLLVHLPGFSENAQQYIESMYAVMGRAFSVLALEGYGESYSREIFIKALEQAMKSKEKQQIVFHGVSFGSSVVYDLISDPANHNFLERNNVTGAILETPILDKMHLKSKARFLPDAVIIRGTMLASGMRKGLQSIRPQDSGSIALSKNETETILHEALREKTVDGKIEIPVHVVFAENESIADNEKIIETLKNQGSKVSSSVVLSASDIGHHIDDGQYEVMWEKEKEMVEGFSRREPSER